MARTLCVAKAIVLDADGDFLLLTRSETHPTLSHFPDLPGGMIEENEEPGAAVKRELLEETGVDVTNAIMLYATTMMIGSASYPTLLYLVRINEKAPTVALSHEHSDFEWVPLSRLTEVEPQLAPTYREAWEYIRDNGILEDIR